MDRTGFREQVLWSQPNHLFSIFGSCRTCNRLAVPLGKKSRVTVDFRSPQANFKFVPPGLFSTGLFGERKEGNAYVGTSLSLPLPEVNATAQQKGREGEERPMLPHPLSMNELLVHW